MRFSIYAAITTLLMAPFAGGCAKNATLDVIVDVPAKPAQFDELHMQVAVRRDDAFELLWDGSSLPETYTLGDAAGVYNMSLVSTDFERDVYIKFSFCRAQNCSARAETVGGTQYPADPQSEIWVSLERPFFLAEGTQWNLELPDIPRCVDDTCSMSTEPGDLEETTISSCAMVASSTPTWRCDIGRCDIACLHVGGDQVGGSCDGGRTGPHFCEE